LKLSDAFFYTQKHPRRGFTPNTLTQLFFNLYRGAGIEGASSHSGRRTFATSLSSKGASIRVLMKLMGHRNISTTIGYVDASDDMLRRAVSSHACHEALGYKQHMTKPDSKSH
jgi:integrase/recombinase XerD